MTFTSSAGDTFSSCTGSSGARGGGGSIICSARMASSGAISAVACQDAFIEARFDPLTNGKGQQPAANMHANEDGLAHVQPILLQIEHSAMGRHESGHPIANLHERPAAEGEALEPLSHGGHLAGQLLWPGVREQRRRVEIARLRLLLQHAEHPRVPRLATHIRPVRQ